jgi:hypothetical protein
MKTGLPLIVLLPLAACSYATVAATPMLLPDGSEGYRYTGRANFAYQTERADRVMAETCGRLGLSPLIVEQETRPIGTGALVSGAAVNIGANLQQEILFKCR